MSESIPKLSPLTLKQGDKVTDVFISDWDLDREYWKKHHKKFDWNYLFYRSILVNNAVYGDEYMKAFGLNVFVPLTFQTIESIAAQGSSRKTDITVKGRTFLENKNAKFMEAMDNAEWQRSGASQARNEGQYNALLFGNGYVFNPFVCDVEKVHRLKDTREDDKKPPHTDDGEETEDTNPFVDRRGKKWEEYSLTRYKGMKPRALNPYYTFPSRHAIDKDNMGRCYVYTILPVKDARKFAVDSGWCTADEAEKIIIPGSVEYFDKVRHTVDSLYSLAPMAFVRTDNTEQVQRPVPSPLTDDGEMCAFIERYENDYYEVRVATNISETLYWDWNVYPHKEIPIKVYQDVRIPNEFLAMGEPELIRWQQIETNKIHNYYLNTVLIEMVQRYAIVPSYLEDESDASFLNPFRPIRLKQIPGIQINQAIQAMPQPEVKRSPVDLMNMVKETSQATTGASDFVVSANDAQSQTATESNNLVAATFARINEKLRRMEEETTSAIVNQWHPCFYTFYDEDQDFLLTGEGDYVRFLPYDRSEANEDKEMIKEASDRLQAEGQTLEQVYMNAGYNLVVFASDLSGDYLAATKFADAEISKEKTIAQFTATLAALKEANKTAQEQGEKKRFDVFKVTEEMAKQLPMINNIDDYILPNGFKVQSVPAPSAMNPQSAQPAENELSPVAPELSPVPVESEGEQGAPAPVMV